MGDVMRCRLAEVLADELDERNPYHEWCALFIADDFLATPQMQAIKRGLALLLHLDPANTEGSLRLMGLDNPVIEWVMS